MTEDLLVFVSIIAVWKIVQVWFLKANIKAKERHIAAVRCEADRLGKEISEVKEQLRSFGRQFGQTSTDWPEEIH